jgi:hypothetical protein
VPNLKRTQIRTLRVSFLRKPSKNYLLMTDYFDYQSLRIESQAVAHSQFSA